MFVDKVHLRFLFTKHFKIDESDQSFSDQIPFHLPKWKHTALLFRANSFSFQSGKQTVFILQYSIVQKSWIRNARISFFVLANFVESSLESSREISRHLERYFAETKGDISPHLRDRNEISR